MSGLKDIDLLAEDPVVAELVFYIEDGQAQSVIAFKSLFIKKFDQSTTKYLFLTDIAAEKNNYEVLKYLLYEVKISNAKSKCLDILIMLMKTEISEYVTEFYSYSKITLKPAFLLLCKSKFKQSLYHIGDSFKNQQLLEDYERHAIDLNYYADDVDSMGTSHLIVAIRNNRNSFAKSLIFHGANINRLITNREKASDTSVLIESMTANNIELFDFLISQDVKLDATDLNQSPLVWAWDNKKITFFCSMFLKLEPYIPMHKFLYFIQRLSNQKVIETGNVLSVLESLKGCINIDVSDNQKNSVLHVAVALGLPDTIIEWLLESGCDVSNVNNDNESILDLIMNKSEFNINFNLLTIVVKKIFIKQVCHLNIHDKIIEKLKILENSQMYSIVPIKKIKSQIQEEMNNLSCIKVYENLSVKDFILRTNDFKLIKTKLSTTAIVNIIMEIVNTEKSPNLINVLMEKMNLFNKM